MMEALFNHLWQSTLVAAVAGLLALALRRNHARVRYAIWLAASMKFLAPFSLLVALGGHFGWSPSAAPAKQQSIFFVEKIDPPVVLPLFYPAVVPASRIEAESFPPAILFSVWLVGCVAVLARWYVSWRRIRAAVQAGSPVEMDAPIRVLSTPAAIEPGVFGIFRPVLLLPEGIATHLAPAQLKAILAHELCHVRRRDNLAATMHMLIEAVFWFHPLVWWIGVRLVAERERACDEEVLRMGSEPSVYAESILRTCQFYLESPLKCMSGVTGSDLKQRIVRIMTHRATHNLTFARKLLLVAAGIAGIAGPVAYGVANAPQSPSPAPEAAGPAPSFEVASIKPNKSGIGVSSWNDHKGRLTGTNITLEGYIRQAYEVRSYQISGPAWIKSERYDITAKPAGVANADQVRLMMQDLLAERFKLTLHREKKMLPVYELVVAKAGPKLQIIETDVHHTSSSANSNPGRVYAQHMSMAQFAEVLSHQTDRPVIDATALKGTYNFKLVWTPDDKQSNSPGQTNGSGTNDGDAPSIFTAVEEQLGLKLEARKAPAQMLVIDHIEKIPTEN
jgi:bla regulator protein blaR1